MSKYTTEIRFLCESKAGKTESVGYNSIDEVLNAAAPLIFNFDFPIYDEAYRLPLEKRILKHYYTREISEETVGLWQLRLEDRLNLIMPYYNKLYTSALLDFNPFYDVDLNEEHTRKNDETKSSNSIVEEIGSSSGEDSTTGTKDGRIDENRSVNRLGEKSGVDSKDKSFKEDTSESNSVIRENSTEGSNSEKVEEKTDTSRTAHNNNWDLFSDTPQSGITGVLNAGGRLADNGYLSSARNEFGSTEESGGNNTNRNTTGEQTEKVQENENKNVTIGKNGGENISGNTHEYVNENENSSNGVVSNNTERTTKEYRNTNTGNTQSSGNESIGSLEDYAQHVYGKRGGISYSKMLIEFRNTFLKIDEMLLNDLSDLFFGLW